MKLVRAEEYSKERERLLYIINNTKSYKCKQDHIKALKKLENQHNEYLYYRYK